MDIKERNKGTGEKWMKLLNNDFSYQSPRPVSRTGGNKHAKENLERGRGSINLCFEQKVNQKYQSPRPVSRCNGNGKEIMLKNRGQMDKVLNNEGNQFYYSSRVPKVTSNEGKAVLEKSYGTMDKVLNVSNNQGYCSARPAPKVPSTEGQNNLQKSQGQGMAHIIKNHISDRSSIQKSRAPLSAEKNATKGNGTMATVLDYNANTNYHNIIPEQRIKPEALKTAEKNKGILGLVLEGKALEQPIQAPRVKAEAEGNFMKNKGSLTQIQASYGNCPVTSRNAPRVKGQGEENALAGRGSVHFLFQKYGNLPRSARPVSRVKPEAKKFAYKNKGCMSSIMHANGKY